MPSVPVTFDPFEGPASLKKLLRYMAIKVLKGELYPRQASTVRALVGMWVRLDEHERLDLLEKRIEQLEATKGTSAR